ncbi:MAG: hypothetical protein H6816_06595 [Phycisphaerales bacterium]|nr:hypothetical protein [Phycisphaerales bacterium]
MPTRAQRLRQHRHGDAVLAMLAPPWSRRDLLDALQLANIARRAIEVEKFGCVPITTDEVLAELRLEAGSA